MHYATLDKYSEQSTQEFISPYGLASLCFALGKNDLGFQWLEKGYAARDVWMAFMSRAITSPSILPRWIFLLRLSVLPEAVPPALSAFP